MLDIDTALGDGAQLGPLVVAARRPARAGRRALPRVPRPGDGHRLPDGAGPRLRPRAAGVVLGVPARDAAARVRSAGADRAVRRPAELVTRLLRRGRRGPSPGRSGPFSWATSPSPRRLFLGLVARAAGAGRHRAPAARTVRAARPDVTRSTGCATWRTGRCARLTNSALFNDLLGDSSFIVRLPPAASGTTCGRCSRPGRTSGSTVRARGARTTSASAPARWSRTGCRWSTPTTPARRSASRRSRSARTASSATTSPTRRRAVVGDNCLLATKAMVPDRRARPGRRRAAGLPAVRDPPLGAARRASSRHLLADEELPATAGPQEPLEPRHDRAFLLAALAARPSACCCSSLLAVDLVRPARAQRRGRSGSSRRWCSRDAATRSLVERMCIGLPPAAAPVLLDLRALLLAARAPVEAERDRLPRAVQRHAVQGAVVAAARRARRAAGSSTTVR